MRVGIVSPYSLTLPGGVQSQVLGLARALNGLGLSARVLAPCDGAPPQLGVTPLGASIPTASNGSVAPIAPDLACALRTVRALSDEAFDVLHLHEPLSPGPCLTALLLRSTPIVGTWHSSGGSRAYFIPGVRWLAGRVNVRVAVSPDARDTAVRALGGTYALSFNGIELDRFKNLAPLPTPSSATSPTGSPAAGPTIAYVGRHEPRKGLAVLLEAMARLGDDTTLWVMSQGPQTAELRERYGHDRRIVWLGRVPEDEKNARIAAADVMCVPSLRGESFGIVLAEAMAAGTPVVASNLDGYRNVARTEEEAVLVPPGDAAALAAGLNRVLCEPSLAADLIAAGHARAQELSMQRLAESYVTHYEDAMRAAASQSAAD